MSKRSKKNSPQPSDQAETPQPLLNNFPAYQVFESTSGADEYDAGADDAAAREMEARLAAREREEKLRCPYLWPKEAPKFRPRSDAILEPIRAALRARPVYRVIIRQVVTAEEKQYLQTRIVNLFGEQLPEVERQLGHLLLTAILEGDKQILDAVGSALHDANRLFHRGKVLDGFHRWRHSQPPEKLAKMTIGEIKESFVVYLGRDELAGGEWKRIVEEFVLEAPRGKPGPKQKTKRRKS